MTLPLIEEDRMNPDTKQPSDTSRLTIPKHVLDRIENEWQQVRSQASSAPAARRPQDDPR